MKPSQKIYISKSSINNAGRGVFANTTITKNETIEISPIILLKGEGENLRKSELYNYYYLWDKHPDAAIALGYGSLYNHSYTPNATYKKNMKDKTVKFIAIKDINKGDEITINYNYGDPNNMSQLWIKSIKPPKVT